MFSFGQAATSATPGNAGQSAWGQPSSQPQPQSQQQQQPQQGAGGFGGQTFGSANPLGQSTALTLGDLTRSQQAQQQQQPFQTPVQPQQQHSSFGAAPSVSTPFSTPSATLPNQQTAGAAKFSSWGATNTTTTTPQTFGNAQHFAFGAPGGTSGADQQQQQNYLQQQQAQLQMQQQQQQQAQQQAQQQQMNYMPGYLSKLKSARPYSSPSRVVEPSSPTQNQQADTVRDAGASAGLGGGSGIGLGASTSGGFDGGEATSSPGAARFSSSFFSLSSPERDTQASRDQRSSTPAGGSIFGPSGLRGSRRTPLARGGSIGPGGASASGAGAELGSSLSRKVSSGGRMRAPSTSPKMIHSASQSRFGAASLGAGAGGMDDDDAPPVEGLMDESGMGDVSFASSDGGAALRSSLVSPQQQQVSARKSSVSFAATPRGGALSPSPSALAPSSDDASFGGTSSSTSGEAARTILVFGYPSVLSHAIVDHFRSMGDVSSIHFDKSLASLGLESVRLSYAQPWMALRAIRRNGEALNIAGAVGEGGQTSGIMVGVRWADDAMHREQVQAGINSPVFTLGVGNGNGGGSSTAPSNGGASASNGNVSDVASSATRPLGATGTGAGGARDRTPAFGRPISIVGSPASAFAPSSKRGGTPIGSAAAGANGSSSPLPSLLKGARNSIFGAPAPASGVQAAGKEGQANNAAGQQQQHRQQQSGVIGRLGDAIFGW